MNEPTSAQDLLNLINNQRELIGRYRDMESNNTAIITKQQELIELYRRSENKSKRLIYTLAIVLLVQSIFHLIN